MADALERGLTRTICALMFGVVSRPYAQRCHCWMPPGCSGCGGVGTVTVTQARQLVRLLKNSGRNRAGDRWYQRPRKPVGNVRFSVKQSRVSNHAKKLQKPSKMPAANMPRLCAGCWGGAMNFEPENYSRRALLWFAAVIDIAGWVAVSS
jgi:hypothetical protein